MTTSKIISGEGEREITLEELKENFLAMVSHELRSPMTAITGFARLLAEGRLGEMAPQQKDILGRALLHAERMTMMVNDLIQLAELQSGLPSSAPEEWVDPVAAVEEALRRVDLVKPGRRAEISYQPPEAEAAIPAIRATTGCVEKVLFNLLDNALKFGKGGGVELGMAVDEGPGEIIFRVRDHGVGIAPEEMDKIFELFHQADNSGSRPFDGMGIGLALASKLASLSGGRIEVKSEPGQGAEFVVVYPVGAGDRVD